MKNNSPLSLLQKISSSNDAMNVLVSTSFDFFILASFIFLLQRIGFYSFDGLFGGGYDVIVMFFLGVLIFHFLSRSVALLSFLYVAVRFVVLCFFSGRVELHVYLFEGLLLLGCIRSVEAAFKLHKWKSLGSKDIEVADVN